MISIDKKIYIYLNVQKLIKIAQQNIKWSPGKNYKNEFQALILLEKSQFTSSLYYCHKRSNALNAFNSSLYPGTISSPQYTKLKEMLKEDVSKVVVPET